MPEIVVEGVSLETSFTSQEELSVLKLTNTSTGEKIVVHVSMSDADKVMHLASGAYVEPSVGSDPTTKKVVTRRAHATTGTPKYTVPAVVEDIFPHESDVDM